MLWGKSMKEKSRDIHDEDEENFSGPTPEPKQDESIETPSESLEEDEESTLPSFLSDVTDDSKGKGWVIGGAGFLRVVSQFQKVLKSLLVSRWETFLLVSITR
jgi:hypothetical protein